MVSVAAHKCVRYSDEMGNLPIPKLVTCGTCHRSWCARCAPTPSDLCPWCNGAGGSHAPIPPRQARSIASARMRRQSVRLGKV